MALSSQLAYYYRNREKCIARVAAYRKREGRSVDKRRCRCGSELAGQCAACKLRQRMAMGWDNRRV